MKRIISLVIVSGLLLSAVPAQAVKASELALASILFGVVATTPFVKKTYKQLQLDKYEKKQTPTDADYNKMHDLHNEITEIKWDIERNGAQYMVAGFASLALGLFAVLAHKNSKVNKS